MVYEYIILHWSPLSYIPYLTVTCPYIYTYMFICIMLNGSLFFVFYPPEAQLL